jgi:zinc transporter ZupT
MAGFWRIICLGGIVAAYLTVLSLAEGVTSENTAPIDAAACSIGPDGSPICTTTDPAVIISSEHDHHDEHSHQEHRHEHEGDLQNDHDHEHTHEHDHEHEHAQEHEHVDHSDVHAPVHEEEAHDHHHHAGDHEEHGHAPHDHVEPHDHTHEHDHTHAEEEHTHEHEGHDHSHNGYEGHEEHDHASDAHSHDHEHEHIHEEHQHEHDHIHTHEGHQHEHVHSHDGHEGHSHDDGHEHDHAHKCDHFLDHVHEHGHTHGEHGHEHEHESEDGSGLHARISEGEKHPVTAVVLTSISGFAAVVGGLIVVAMGAPSPTTMGHMLSFAAGIMLYISYADLIPHAIADMEESAQAHMHDHSSGGGGHSHAGHVHSNAGGVGLEGADPHAGHSHGSLPAFIHANAWMFAGMVFFLLVAAALPTGEENGHGHSHGVTPSTPTTPTTRRSSKTSAKQTIQEKEASDAVAAAKRLMMTGLAAAIGISLHNLPEGLIVYNQTITGLCRTDVSDPFTPPTFFATAYNSVAAAVGMAVLPENFDVSKCMTRGAAVTFAIFLHNIPEGMAVASPVYVSTGSRWQAMKYCIISAVFEPLAAILFGLAFSSFLTRYIIAALNAMVAGIMISLCLVELLPVAASHIGPKVRHHTPKPHVIYICR